MKITTERLYRELVERVGRLPTCRRRLLENEIMKRNTLYGSISAALKAAIEADDRTPCRIATEAGVDTASMYRFLDGTRQLRQDTIDALCETLGLELSAKQRRVAKK
jgi:DNA-binding phage protein